MENSSLLLDWKSDYLDTYSILGTTSVITYYGLEVSILWPAILMKLKTYRRHKMHTYLATNTTKMTVCNENQYYKT